MDLYIRKKEIINLDKDINKFQSTFSVKKVIVDDDVYLKFFYNFFYYGFDVNDDIIVRITLSNTKNITNAEVITSLGTTTSNIINNNQFIFSFNTGTDPVEFKFNSSPWEYHNILKFELLDKDYDALTIDSDINIVNEFYNDTDALFESYSKTFNIYKTEFNKIDINSLYDAIIYRDSYKILDGELEITELNDDIYSAKISKPVTYGLNIIKELKIKDYDYDFKVDYSINDYSNRVGNVTDKYNYYISRENQVADGFLKKQDKNDDTLITDISGTKFYKNYKSSFNFNTYVRPCLSMNYLFNLAHDIAGYDYELPTLSGFENLMLTTNFYKDYESITYQKNLQFNFNINSNGSSDDDTWILVNKKLSFGDGSNKILSNFINDINTSNEFKIQFSYTAAGTIAFGGKLSLFMLDSAGNPDVEMISFQLPQITSSVSTASYWDSLPSFDMKYHYSKYGYAITLSIYQIQATDDISGFNTHSVVGEDKNIINIKAYKLQLINSNISVNELLSDNSLTFLDIIKTISNIYNLQPVLNNNKIKYSLKNNILNNDTLILTNNVDINKYKKVFNNISKIKNNYNDSSVNEDINHNLLTIENIKNNDTIKKDIKLELIYENNNSLLTDNQYFNVDYNYFLGNFVCYDYENNVNLYLFDIFKQKNDRIKPALMFLVNKYVGTTIEIRDWTFDTKHTSSYLNTSRTFEPQFGLWFKKNDNIDLYKYNNYSNINNMQSAYDKFHKTFNDSLYSNYEELNIDVYNLTSVQLKNILDYSIIIIENQKYIVKQLTISNLVSNLILLKIT